MKLKAFLVLIVFLPPQAAKRTILLAKELGLFAPNVVDFLISALGLSHA